MGDNAIEQLCRDAAIGATWFITQTQYRKETLRDAFRAEDETAICFTFPQAILRILRQLSPPVSPGSSSTFEVELVIESLLTENQASLPILSAIFHSDESIYRGRSRVISRLLSFFNLVRAQLIDDKLLASVLDEFGNELDEKARLGEMLQLLELLRHQMASAGKFDALGALDFFIENEGLFLRDSESLELPETILFERPGSFSPLEKEALRVLRQKLDIRFAVDTPVEKPSTCLSVKGVAGLASYLSDFEDEVVIIGERLSERESLVDYAIDGLKETSTRNLVAEIGVWTCEEREEEVRAAARFIRSQLEQGVSANEIHLVVMEVDAYREKLLRIFEEEGLPLQIKFGPLASQTTSGAVFASLIDVLKSDSLSPLLSLLGTSGLRLRQIDKPSFNTALTRLSEETPVSEAVSIAKISRALCSTEVVREFTKKLLRRGVSTATRKESDALIAETLSIMLRDSRRAPEQLVATAAIILACSAKISELSVAFSDSPEQALRGFRGLFFLLAPTLVVHERETFADDKNLLHFRERAVFAKRKLLQNLRLFERELPAEAQHYRNPKRVFAILERILAETRVPQRDDESGAERRIRVTEFLDLRGARSKVSVVLGLTRRTFPVAVSRGRGEITEQICLELEKRRSVVDSMEESYYFLAELLRNSEQLVLSSPLLTENGEEYPPDAIKSLSARCHAENFSASDFSHLASVDDSNPAARLLSARHSSTLTAYDGVIGEKGVSIARRLNPRVFDDGGRHSYSVSQLEGFADCPHHFYFRNVLRLSEKGVSLEKDGRALLGTLVHRCLELFFKDKRLLDLLEKSFLDACKAMHAIASQQIEESGVRFEDTSYGRFLKRQLLLGLDEEKDSLPRGLLKAALVFQIELVKTTPEITEYSFALELPDLSEGVESNKTFPFLLRGTIDRVDRANDAEVYYVRDYKTGSLASISEYFAGLALQLPVYCLAASSILERERESIRGTYWRLQRPNQTRDLEDAKNGILIEHIGPKATYYNKPVTEKIYQQSAEAINGMHQAISQGNFAQKLDTKRCQYCDYRLICARDEGSIIKKNADAGEVEDVVLAKVEKEAASESVATLAVQTLSPEQELACRRDRPLAVHAGAGSGKTFVLRTRIIELLLDLVPLHSIVAITFTERAAGEIANRVEQSIGEILRTGEYRGDPISEKQRSHLLFAKAHLSQAYISTIHSFAAEILKFGADAGLVIQGQEVVSGVSQVELLNQAYEQLLNSNDGEYLSLLQVITDAGIPYFSLKEGVIKLILAPTALDDLKRSLEGADNGTSSLEQFFEEVLVSRQARELKRIQQFASSWLADCSAWLESDVAKDKLKEDKREAFEKACELVESFIKSCSIDPKVALKTVAILRDHLESINAGLNKSKANPVNYWKEIRDFICGGSSKGIRLDWRVLKANPEDISAILESSAQLARFAFGCRAAYERIKREQGVVDFDDLIKAAHHLVCGNVAPKERIPQKVVISRLQDQFKHLLIDEFQDTDRFQWELLSTLFSADRKGSSLFIVGDPQQGIYGFRGGDIRVFNQATEEIVSRGGEKVFLRDNYRSNESVVTFVNTFFESLFALDFEEGTKPRVPTAVEAEKMFPKRAKPLKKGVLAIDVEEFEESSSIGSGNAAKEASAVASFIKDVLQNTASWPAVESHREGGAIAVLTRSVSKLVLVARALEAEKVPFSISHSSGFYDLLEIQMIENLLIWLAEPENEIALAGILRSPIFGFDDLELVELLDELDGSFAKLLSDTSVSARVSDVRAALQHFLGWSRLFSPSNVVRAVMEGREVYQAYMKAGVVEASKNIERCIDRIALAEREAECIATMAGVRDWLLMQRKFSDQAPNANSLSHPVVLSTIHGSKGLEYPMVILPFLKKQGQERRGDFASATVANDEGIEQSIITVRLDEGENQRKQTFLHALAEDAERGLLSSEERRVFYVACTRAKDHLIFCYPDIAKGLKKVEKETEESLWLSSEPAKWLLALADADSSESELSFGDGRIRVEVGP